MERMGRQLVLKGEWAVWGLVGVVGGVWGGGGECMSETVTIRRGKVSWGAGESCISSG